MARSVIGMLEEDINGQSCRVGIIPETKDIEPPARIDNMCTSSANCRYKSTQNGKPHCTFYLSNLAVQRYFTTGDVLDVRQQIQ